jgi:mRNA interferase HigB
MREHSGEEKASVHIISKKRLKDYAKSHASAKPGLEAWIRLAQVAQWASLAEVHDVWASADLVGQLTVFNVGGNHFRLITKIDYRHGKIFIRDILTHAEYDREEWKNDAWFD